MKFLPAQFAFILQEGDARRNLRALAMYLAFLTAVIILYAILFHWIMWTVEGQRHSWHGKTLSESGIGTRSGLNVVAIDTGSGTIANPPPETQLGAGGQLVMIGTMEQRAIFAGEHER